MKRNERGFTFIELLISIAIIGLIAGAASTTTFQVMTGTNRSNDRMTVIRQVQNAGYWISRDTRMAEGVSTAPDFLTLTWTEWDYDEVSTYHSVTYSFQDLSDDGIGELLRTHWSSAGANEQILVAEYISEASTTDYTSPLLTVQITASLGEANETREYRVWRRLGF
ncbi:type II secretion system protein J [Chloroflexota bacterium]